MKGEFISIETARINADIEKENLELQLRIEKAIEYMQNNFVEHIGMWTIYPPKLLNILEGKDE